MWELGEGRHEALQVVCWGTSWRAALTGTDPKDYFHGPAPRWRSRLLQRLRRRVCSSTRCGRVADRRVLVRCRLALVGRPLFHGPGHPLEALDRYAASALAERDTLRFASKTEREFSPGDRAPVGRIGLPPGDSSFSGVYWRKD